MDKTKEEKTKTQNKNIQNVMEGVKDIKKPITKGKGIIKLNFINIILLLAFISLPVAGLMLHLKIHKDLSYLTYILLFDIIIITSFYLFNKTRFYGFVLNTVFFTTGIIAHLTIIGKSTIPDILLAIPDFSIGCVLWILNMGDK